MKFLICLSMASVTNISELTSSVINNSVLAPFVTNILAI